MSDADRTAVTHAFPAAALTLVLAILGCGEPPDPWTCDDCNVVLISIDTLRRDRLGIYGYTNDTSPNIDRFFAAGTRYDHATTSAPCTIPAIRQLLTGSARPLRWRKRLAEYLRDDGYRTAAFASHHLFRIGHTLPREEYARGFDVFDLQLRTQTDAHGMTGRGARGVTQPALEWLRGSASEGPFFLWLHYFDPHDPYEPPREHRLFGGADAAEGSGDRRTAMRQAHGLLGWSAEGSRHAFSLSETKLLNALYDGEVRILLVLPWVILGESRRFSSEFDPEAVRLSS